MTTQIKQLEAFYKAKATTENAQRCWAEYQSVAPAAHDELAAFEHAFGVQFPAAWADWFSYKNGSSCLFEFLYTTYKAGTVVPFTLLSLEEIREEKSYFCSENTPLKNKDGAVVTTPPAGLDARIQPFAEHEKWIPIGQMLNGSVVLLLDFAPAPGGTMGQVLAYQYDPDEIYYVCETLPQLLEDTLQNLAKGQYEKFQEHQH